MKHVIAIDFTYDEQQAALNKGRQAFLNGQSIACPYYGAELLQLRIKWLSGYTAARTKSLSKRGEHNV